MYEYLRKLMLGHFLPSCHQMQARNKKDLAWKIGLNLADYLQQKKRDAKRIKIKTCGLRH